MMLLPRSIAPVTDMLPTLLLTHASVYAICFACYRAHTPLCHADMPPCRCFDMRYAFFDAAIAYADYCCLRDTLV